MGDLPVECESNSVSIESNRLYVQRWQAGKRNEGGERTGVDVRLLLARGSTGAQFRDSRGGRKLLFDVGARGIGDRVGQGFVRRVVELEAWFARPAGRRRSARANFLRGNTETGPPLSRN